jgi:hypothetical protein
LGAGRLQSPWPFILNEAEFPAFAEDSQQKRFGIAALLGTIVDGFHHR